MREHCEQLMKSEHVLQLDRQPAHMLSSRKNPSLQVWMVAIVQVATPFAQALHYPLAVRYNPSIQVEQEVEFEQTEQPKEHFKHWWLSM